MKNIIYSHTSYADVLRIQTDYVSRFAGNILLINGNSLDLQDIYSKYERVIFYDDSKEYAARLIECLSQIEHEYITLVHDIDILVEMDEEKMSSFYSFMKERGVDRIDLKYTKEISGLEMINIDSENHGEWSRSESPKEGSLYLVRQEGHEGNANLYNVNPSIWKRDSLLDLLLHFPHKTYRTIEELDVQAYCRKMEIYKLHSDSPLQCGYFECAKPFVYLHISHSGRLLLLDGRNVTEYGQPYSYLAQEYANIVEKYELKKSPKFVNLNPWRI